MLEEKNNIKKTIADSWKEEYEEIPLEEAEKSWEIFEKKHFKAYRKRRITKWVASISGIAAVLFLGITFILGAFKTEYILVENTSEKVKQINLPDGTLVTLRKNSFIKYSENFEENRFMIFSGDGFFQVAKDKEHPFSVEANNTITTVTGTTFELNVKSLKNVEVILYEGSVNVNYKDDIEFWPLTPGEIINLDGRKGEVSTFNNVFYTINGSYIDLNDTKLSEFVKYLENRFGYAFKIDNQLLNKTITLRIKTSDSLQNIAKLISIINESNLNIDEQNKIVILK